MVEESFESVIKKNFLFRKILTLSILTIPAIKNTFLLNIADKNKFGQYISSIHITSSIYLAKEMCFLLDNSSTNSFLLSALKSMIRLGWNFNL